MAIRYREAQIDSGTDGFLFQQGEPDSVPSLTNIEAPNSDLPTDIRSPTAPSIASITDGTSVSDISAAPTPSLGLLTDTAPLSTTTSRPSISTSIITPTQVTISITDSAAPTHTAIASHGMSPGRLIAAIVVPIAILAILIPIITLWILNHRRKLQEQRYVSQRSSNSREPMIQKQVSYRAQPPSRPLRTPSLRQSGPHNVIQEPPSAQMRNSLGLFNFELSPTAATSPMSLPGSRESGASPRFRFSIARALEMRRSQPSIVQPHARTSDTRVVINERSQRSDSNRNSQIDMPNATAPHVLQRPSKVAATRSHFAPLSRIGTRNMGERSPPPAITNNNPPEPDRLTYTSSDPIDSSDTHVRAGSRSSSPSLGWPSPPHKQGVVARKPVPTQAAAGIISQATCPEDASHLNGPFSSYLPDRISDVSGFSIDTSQWEDPPRPQSVVSSVGSLVDSDGSSRVLPYHLI